MRLTRRVVRAILSDQRGAALVLVMLAMVAVLSAAALAVDVGKLLAAKTEAQRAADSAALAGASAFIDDPGNAEAVAKARAEEYSELHSVRNQSVDLVPAEDVQVDLANFRVDVTVRHTTARSNPIPTFFARIFGVGNVDVQAHAAAEAVPANAVECLTPWAVGDMWEDTWAGGDPGPFDYDDVDRSNTPTSGDSFDNYCPCARARDGALIVEPSYQHIGIVCQTDRCTGYGSDIRDHEGYTADVGRVLTLKPGNPNQAWSPGWFMAWRPTGDMGGSDYRENIINCIDGEFDTDNIVPIDTEQGNMIGPTIQGVTERIDGDPHFWEDGCTTGLTECVRGPGPGAPGPESCGGTADGAVPCSGYQDRLITVPLMDPSEHMRNGLAEIQFRGFMRLFLDDPNGNDITGHILGLGGTSGDDGDDDTGAIPLYLKLID